MDKEKQDNKTGNVKGVLTGDIQKNLTPRQILDDLKKGNERFISGKLIERDYSAQLKASAKGQYPKAVILTCLDSRIPVETIFDQGIGDIFVGRVAGNIINEDMLGSLEFAASVSGSKLILILGHSSCGAIMGCIDKENIKEYKLEYLDKLLENIDPVVLRVLKKGEERSSRNTDLVERATKQNVIQTMNKIRKLSTALKTLEREGNILLIGGIYDLNTGKVEWMEE